MNQGVNFIVQNIQYFKFAQVGIGSQAHQSDNTLSSEGKNPFSLATLSNCFLLRSMRETPVITITHVTIQFLPKEQKMKAGTLTSHQRPLEIHSDWKAGNRHMKQVCGDVEKTKNS